MQRKIRELRSLFRDRDGGVSVIFFRELAGLAKMGEGLMDLNRTGTAVPSGRIQLIMIDVRGD